MLVFLPRFVLRKGSLHHTADKADEHIAGVDQGKQKRNAQGYRRITAADKGVVKRKFEQDYRRAEELQDIRCCHPHTAKDNIPVGISGGFARPAHTLAEECSPRGLRADSGGE